MSTPRQLTNYINGRWRPSSASESVDVVNPATAELLAQGPLSGEEDVNAAVDAASRAFDDWRRQPPEARVQYLFRLRRLMHDHIEELARLITLENGKTLAESRGELRRGIENIEVACGITTLMQGINLEDAAPGIDEIMIRQPLGVVGIITPFNFPVMVPLWFLPCAIACGNTVILKPSERVPLAIRRVVELIDESGLPPGVVNLVNGSKAAVDALLDHPAVRAVSFVGSTPVAKAIYARAAANGKRVQCQGGAKNHVIVMPDAEMEAAVQAVANAAFGCAGQRCLAASVAVPVGKAHAAFREALVERARSIRVGGGLEEGVEMGPVITRASQERIEGLITRAAEEGARVLVDGRATRVPGYERGYFVSPTVLEDAPSDGDWAHTETFGPVLNLARAETLDEAFSILARSPFGNASSIFTRSGAIARRFRYEAPTGNVGVNIGVAAPMAFFPFSGWRDSFRGVVHGQGRDGVEFYTEKKVVIERWPDADA